MNITKFPYGPIGANMYRIDSGTMSVLIDPCVSPDHLPERSAPPAAILITHCHYDHISCLEEIRTAWAGSDGREAGIPVYAHPLEFPAFRDPVRNGSVFFMNEAVFRKPDAGIRDGESIDFGGGSFLRAIHTPGHTPGSLCFLLIENGVSQVLFSGDTLFKGSAGRTDLGGDPQQLRGSLLKLSMLGDEVTVCCGHGDDSVMSYEKKYNPFLNGSA